MKKYEIKFINTIHEVLIEQQSIIKKLIGQEREKKSIAYSKMITAAEYVEEVLNGKPVFCFLSNMITFYLKISDLHITQVYKICLKILENNTRYIDNLQEDDLFDLMVIGADVVDSYLKKHRMLDEKDQEIAVFDISSTIVKKITNPTYLKIIEGIRKEYDLFAEVNRLKTANQDMYEIFKNGLNSNNTKKYVELVLEFDLNKSLCYDLSKYLSGIGKKKEEDSIVSNGLYKTEQKKNSLNNKEYKSIRNKIDKVFDVKTNELKRIILEEEKDELATLIYLAYGVDKTRSFLYQVLMQEQVQAKNKGYAYYTVNNVIEMLNKALYNRDKLMPDVVLDIETYIEILSDDISYSEFIEWLPYILKLIKEHQYKICLTDPTYELEKLQEKLKTLDYNDIVKKI